MKEKKLNAKDSNTAIDKLIGTISRATNTLRKNVQKAAVLIARHAMEHGDYSKANALVNALGDGINGRALVFWFETYVGLKVDEETPENGFTGWSGKKFITDNLAKGIEKPWYECKKQSAFGGFDFVTELEKLIKKAASMEKKALNAKKEGDEDLANSIVIDFETVRKVKEAAGITVASKTAKA